MALNESGRMAYKTVYIGVFAAMVAFPAVGHADESQAQTTPGATDFYAGLEDLPLRRYIAGIGHLNFAPPPAYAAANLASDAPYIETRGGSAGGYVNFGSPTTGVFLGSVAGEKSEPLIDGVEFGVNWLPDVSGAEIQDIRTSGRSFSGGDVGRVGVRADLTALLYDKAEGDGASSAWRLTGMLGSTSLSLLSNDSNLALSSESDGGGLLWDVGVGWSSGAMSLNAGYQSAYSFDVTGEEGSAIAVLSLGADYTLIPGLSVYGELNMIDGPPDDGEGGLGTVVIFGTGMNF